MRMLKWKLADRRKCGQPRRNRERMWTEPWNPETYWKEIEITDKRKKWESEGCKSHNESDVRAYV
jgi:hypothetical protein